MTLNKVNYGFAQLDSVLDAGSGQETYIQQRAVGSKVSGLRSVMGTSRKIPVTQLAANQMFTSKAVSHLCVLCNWLMPRGQKVFKRCHLINEGLERTHICVWAPTQ